MRFPLANSIYVRSLALAVGSAIALALGSMLVIWLSPVPFDVPISSFEIARALKQQATTRSNLVGKVITSDQLVDALAAPDEVESIMREALALQLNTTASDVFFHFKQRTSDSRLNLARNQYELELLRSAALYRGDPGFAVMAFDEFSAGVKVDASHWRVLEMNSKPGPRWRIGMMKLIGLALLMILPIVWFFSSALAKPIRAFSQAAERIGRGSFERLTPTGTTELRRAALAMNEMQERLQNFLRERTDMIAAIAHDLRTPIARLSFLLADLPAPLSEKVARQLAEMNQMIGGTLDFVRNERLDIQRVELDLSLLVEGVVDDFADQGNAASFQGDSKAIVLGDPVALRRLFSNLIDNALKYGERAEVSLQIVDGQKQVLITDAGPGLSDADLAKVFQPFYRVESSRNRAFGGVGLGLSIAKAIVLAHGGQIELRNKAQAPGLQVLVRLP